LRRFGANFRVARQRANLTQQDISERTGRGQAYVSAIERGAQNITVETMAELAAAVNANVTELLGTTEPNPRAKPKAPRT